MKFQCELCKEYLEKSDGEYYEFLNDHGFTCKKCLENSRKYSMILQKWLIEKTLKWFKTIEYQPEKNINVLGYHPNSKSYEIVSYYGQEISDPKTFEDYGWSHGLYISHWMPLPKEPQ